jgi:signal transduction histidine kinase
MLYLNAAGRKMMGVAPDEDISGSSIDRCYPRGARETLWEQAIPTAIRQGTWSGENVLMGRNRQEIPISQVIIAHRAPNGMVQFLSTIARDISERKQAEQALQETNCRLQEALAELCRTQERIIQAERLHALQQMAGAIIHDVSNLMTPITGFTEMLLNRPELLRDPEQVRRNLELVKIAAMDAANVVRRLQFFYQAPEKPVNWSRVDLNQVARQAAEIAGPWCLAQAQTHGISISVETPLQEVPPIEGNEVELREALTNLIFNAVDAMPAGGGTVTLRTYCQDSQVTLQVQDTGEGMTDEVLQRCMEPFFTTKGPRGTGLGLAVVYGAIQRHEGSIAIESKVGKGTTVTIRLPTPTGPAEAGSAQQALDLPRPLRILLVDDEPLVLKGLRPTLPATATL